MRAGGGGPSKGDRDGGGQRRQGALVSRGCGFCVETIVGGQKRDIRRPPEQWY